MSFTHYINDIRVYPVNVRKLSLIEQKENNEVFYRIKLNGSPEFRDNITSKDYTLLKSLETDYRWNSHIYKIHDTILDKDYKFEFRIEDLRIDDRSGKITIKSLSVRDKYTIIKERESDEINVIENIDPETINIKFKSYLVFIIRLKGIVPDNYSVYADLTDFDLPIYDLLASEQVKLSKNVNFDPSGWNTIEEDEEFITYARTVAASDYAIPSTDYIEKTFPGTTYADLSETHWGPINYSWNGEKAYFWIHKDYYNGGDYSEYLDYRGFKLSDILSALLPEDFDADLRSSFLFDNPICVSEKDPFNGTHPPTEWNYVLNSALYRYYLIPMSSFKRPGAYEGATTSKITFKKLMDALKSYFNLAWHIDKDENLRIEHISYYIPSEGTILSGYNDYIKEIYEYKNNEIFNEISFDNQLTGSADFTKKSLLFDDIPALDGAKKKLNEIIISDIYTDVDYCNSILSELPDSGFMLVETTGDRKIKVTEGLYTGDNVQNANMSLSNLLVNYYRHNLPVNSVTIHETEYEALSLKKLKIYEPIDTEITEEINTFEYVNTYIGSAEVESLETIISDEQHKKLTLAYE